ncbi:MAG: hypothetical protein Q9209_005217 [Squamulea sp. 1 TL-2023]
MSLGSGLRVRKDLAEHHQDEEAYLLSPTAEYDGHFLKHRKFQRQAPASKSYIRPVLIIFFLSCFVLISVYLIHPSFNPQPPRCVDTPNNGYQCQPQISHSWGQYSPFFSAPSEIPDTTPSRCQISFAQILSRHGARDPTASKTKVYNSTIQKLKANVRQFNGKYAFLDRFRYTLGADQLTLFGEQQMINSGVAFYNRYERLAKQANPFIRASGEDRVVQSARNFSQGFHQVKSAYQNPDANYPYPILVIPEGEGFNNTLDHGLCTTFEGEERYSSVGSKAQQTFLDTFLPTVTDRLNADLQGANLTAIDTVNLFDLCPFTTVASPLGAISPFCCLFTLAEWKYYGYYQSLGKFYGYGPGNPLGPTQGVGFVNELIARLTGKAVHDHTSINGTLDNSNITFPLGQALYVDVSHDNDMTAIFSALRLYDSTRPLSNSSTQSTNATAGYSAAWTVPFAGRAYFEKMKCAGEKEELVRIIVNNRVIPLEMCDADELGRCTLTKFIRGLSFAAEGGRWDSCFT